MPGWEVVAVAVPVCKIETRMKEVPVGVVVEEVAMMIEVLVGVVVELPRGMVMKEVAGGMVVEEALGGMIVEVTLLAHTLISSMYVLECVCTLPSKCEDS